MTEKAPRPTALPVRIEGIPDELRDRKQWVVWQYFLKDPTAKKPWTKKPLRPNGQPAATTDSKTWSSFDAVARAYAQGRYDGIGFVFTADDAYVGVDLDAHRHPETGALDEVARDVIARLPGAYVEVSPSATGLHLIARGVLPPGPRKRDEIGVEMYEAGRYFCMTGVLP